MLVYLVILFIGILIFYIFSLALVHENEFQDLTCSYGYYLRSG